MVCLHVNDNRLYMFVVQPEAKQPIIKSLNINKGDIDAFLNSYMDSFHLMKNDDARSSRSLFSILGECISKPLADVIAAGDRIIFVPSNWLGYVPLHLAPWGDGILMDEHEIVYIPSASILRHCMNINPKRLDPAFRASSIIAYGIDFEDDVKSIVKNFKAHELILGSKDKTDWSRVTQGCRGQDVVHFSCHGSFAPHDLSRSGLLLTPSSCGDQVPELLSLDKIYGMELSSYLVVLGACNTALYDIRAGDDPIGIIRGFLYAGTPSVIGSLWPVDEQATIALMNKFYTLLTQNEIGKGAALRQAQMDVRKIYPDPLDWAGFILVGDWV